MATVNSTTSSTSSISAQLQQIAEQLMANDRKPLENLQAQKTNLQSRLTVYQGLGTKLSSLLSLAKGLVALDTSNPLRAMTVTGNDTNILSVTAGDKAAAGTYIIEIQQLASRQTLTSGAVSGSDKAIASVTDGLGSVQAEAAAKDSEAGFRVTAGGKSVDLSVKISAGATKADVLSKVAQAISGAKLGLTALVLDVGNGDRRLQIQSQQAGPGTVVTDIQDLQGTWMRDLGLTLTAGKAAGSEALIQEGTQAKILVNGVPVIANDNVIKNGIPGLTLTLVGLGSQTIRVARDEEAAVKGVNDFLSGYNKAVDEIRKQTQPADTNGENRGVLAGDVTFTRLRTVLRDAATRPLADQTAGFRQPSEIGLSSDRDGHLSVSNSKTLQTALEDNPGGVEAVMREVGSRLQTILNAYSRAGGILVRDQQTVRTQIRRLDSSIASTTDTLTHRESALVAQLAQLETTVGALGQQKTYLAALLGTGDQTTTA